MKPHRALWKDTEFKQGKDECFDNTTRYVLGMCFMSVSCMCVYVRMRTRVRNV